MHALLSWIPREVWSALWLGGLLGPAPLASVIAQSALVHVLSRVAVLVKGHALRATGRNPPSTSPTPCAALPHSSNLARASFLGLEDGHSVCLKHFPTANICSSSVFLKLFAELHKRASNLSLGYILGFPLHAHSPEIHQRLGVW